MPICYMFLLHEIASMLHNNRYVDLFECKSLKHALFVYILRRYDFPFENEMGLMTEFSLFGNLRDIIPEPL